MKSTLIAVLALCSFTLSITADAAPSGVGSDSFNFPSPASLPPATALWSTRYYVHAVEAAKEDDPKSIPLLSKTIDPLGVWVTNADFCFGALQGTIAVAATGKVSIYNVDGLLPSPPSTLPRALPISKATCSYRSLSPEVNSKLGRQAWVKLGGNATYGLGVDGLRLVPFRTIAVDRNTFPIGTVLFIPALKGFAFSDKGAARVHDGYVIAGDVGGGVKTNHVDLFTGNYRGLAPTYVKSTPADTFKAYVITDTAIISALKNEATYRR